MQETIKMLIELQQFDSVLFEKKKLMDDIPKKMQELDAMLEEKSTNLRIMEEESKKLLISRKEKEGDLKAKEEAVKKHQAQLYQVKTNQEYTALEKEIGSVTADSSLLEEEIITLLDRVDEIKKKIAKEKEILDEERKKADAEKMMMESQRKAAEAEYENLSGKRKEFASKINKDALAKYERILYKRDGLAMVPVLGGACGGCNMNLPPQVINEAKMKKKLTFCGNCARILYSE